MRMRRLTGMVLLGLALPASAAAELRQVRVSAPGMDCASCARAMSSALKKVAGVESVDLSVETASVEIRLRADNRVTLERIRREMRAFGFHSGDAAITARGKVAERDGQAVFDLLNDSTLPLADKPPSVSTAVVEITGVSKFEEKSGERLTIATVK
jgi:copper chaperone CopZ